MNNLANLLTHVYEPKKALIIFECDKNNEYYVESYDFDKNGHPINPHPLTLRESNSFSDALDGSEKNRQGFLVSRGLMPPSILTVNSQRNGYAVWFTPTQTVQLLFKPELGIENGLAEIPPMVWKATKTELSVWALAKNIYPNLNTPIYFAPFFNIYDYGKVCMGNVSMKISPQCALEEFMESWKIAFFQSKFSHLIRSTSPVDGNIILLWKELVGTNQPFPLKKLIKANKKLKDIL
jgi:PRTRC genetic system protein B